MRRTITIFGITMVAIAGVAVLFLKLAVHEKGQELQALRAAIKNDQEAIRVLEAEWAYRTSPAKLQDKSMRFLALMPPKASQIVLDPSVIPLRPKGEEVDGNQSVLLPEEIRKRIKEASKGKSSKRRRGTGL